MICLCGMETINVEEYNADIKSPFLDSYTYMCVRVCTCAFYHVHICMVNLQEAYQLKPYVRM